MKKRLFILTIILLTIFAIFMKFDIIKIDKINTPKEVEEKKDEIKLNDFYNLNYIPDMYINEFKKNILSYDKTNLVFTDSDLSKSDSTIYSSTIPISNYRIKTNENYIYLMDCTSKRLYKLNDDGVTLIQKSFTQDIYNLYILSDDKIVVHYRTQVGADGLIILDANLEEKSDLSFTNTSITMIKEDIVNKNMIVSSLMKVDSGVVNKFYVYNNKMELVLTKDFQNFVVSNFYIGTNSIISIDPDYMLLTDKSFENPKKVSSNTSFLYSSYNNNNLYIMDGDKKIKIFDKDLELLKEYDFENAQMGLEVINDKVITYSKNTININDKLITSQNEITGIFVLDDKRICLVFRYGLKVLEV